MLLVSPMIENRLRYLTEYLLTHYQNKPTLSNEPMRMCKCSSIFTCICVLRICMCCILSGVLVSS